MDFEGILLIFEQAGSYAPFPFLLVVLILLAFAWLWVEYQITRVGRAISVWRRPFPVLAEISRVSVWIIRLSWALMWVWLILFVVLVASFWAVRTVPGYPISVHRDVLIVGHLWRQVYDFFANILLAPAPPWLRPASISTKSANSFASLMWRSFF